MKGLAARTRLPPGWNTKSVAGLSCLGQLVKPRKEGHIRIVKLDMLRASLVGIPEAMLVAVPVSGGLFVMGPSWGWGVLLGVLAVTAGRLVGLLFLTAVVGGRGSALAIALMSPARLLLTGALAVAGIVLGLAPGAVALGLALPPLVLWAKSLTGRKPPC